MLPFRARFTLKRITSRRYYQQLSQFLIHPFSFYTALLQKLVPGLSSRVISLRLKDGKILFVPEFWTLFLFDEIFVQQCYEAPEVMRRAPYDTVIDIGANIGLFTVRSKQLWPEARVISMEPHPDNFAKLRRHVERNHLENIQTLQSGIAEKCGCFELYLSPRNIGGHSMYKKEKESTSISIPTLTLAEVMGQAKNGSNGTLLKIDCEGCEYPLLNTMTPELAARISCIIFEPEPTLYDLNVLLDKLKTLGFGICYHQNLIVAGKS